jgi:hypothetical protein
VAAVPIVSQTKLKKKKINLERRILDKILYEVDSSDIPQ